MHSACVKNMFKGLKRLKSLNFSHQQAQFQQGRLRIPPFPGNTAGNHDLHPVTLIYVPGVCTWFGVKPREPHACKARVSLCAPLDPFQTALWWWPTRDAACCRHQSFSYYWGTVVQARPAAPDAASRGDGGFGVGAGIHHGRHRGLSSDAATPRRPLPAARGRTWMRPRRCRAVCTQPGTSPRSDSEPFPLPSRQLPRRLCTSGPPAPAPPAAISSSSSTAARPMAAAGSRSTTEGAARLTAAEVLRRRFRPSPAVGGGGGAAARLLSPTVNGCSGPIGRQRWREAAGRMQGSLAASRGDFRTTILPLLAIKW